MKSKKLQIHVLLPNGKNKQFKLEPGKNWQSSLKSEIQNLYPKSNNIRFVEDLPKKPLTAGKTFESNIMFEIRKNYFALGHITADAPE